MENTPQTQERFTLLDAFLNNKEVPIREFYISEYPKTKRFILSNGGTIDNAKDVFQEAYFSIWKRLSTGKFVPKNRSEIEAYLFTTAKNKWIDQLRAESKKKKISINEINYQLAVDEVSQISESNERDYKITLTLTAFENLGQACRNLLTQFYFYKMSFREIAEQLHIEEASVKNKKYRCIQKLKELASNNYKK
tara:strand:+ start:189 stop:770 length:582 start_codon:yes stop_codon:yes gene_type:complete